jgi:hypothetical protein
MIIEIFIIYMIVVLVTVLIKAIGKIGQGISSYNSNETLREQWRKNREEIKELKEKVKASGLDTLFPKKENRRRSKDP